MEIEIPENLYVRLGRHTEGFETPASVIERLLDAYDKNQKQKKPEIIFVPDEKRFRLQLLQKQSAWKLFEFSDSTSHLEQWNANRFTESSNLRANLWSGSLRDWQTKGIVRLTLSIDKPEPITEQNLLEGGKMRIQVNKLVKDHISNIIEYCKTHPKHLEQLMDKKWSNEHFGISFPLIEFAQKVKKDPELHKRYWVNEFQILDNKYRFCSQFGGNNIVGTKTMSEFHGEKFTRYLKAKNLILAEYQIDQIQYIVKS